MLDFESGGPGSIPVGENVFWIFFSFPITVLQLIIFICTTSLNNLKYDC